MLHSNRPLIQISVSGCTIKTIKKENFKGEAVALGNWRSLEENVSRSVIKKGLGEA